MANRTRKQRSRLARFVRSRPKVAVGVVVLAGLGTSVAASATAVDYTAAAGGAVALMGSLLWLETNVRREPGHFDTPLLILISVIGVALLTSAALIAKDATQVLVEVGAALALAGLVIPTEQAILIEAGETPTSRLFVGWLGEFLWSLTPAGQKYWKEQQKTTQKKLRAWEASREVSRPVYQVHLSDMRGLPGMLNHPHDELSADHAEGLTRLSQGLPVSPDLLRSVQTANSILVSLPGAGVTRLSYQDEEGKDQYLDLPPGQDVESFFESLENLMNPAPSTDDGVAGDGSSETS